MKILKIVSILLLTITIFCILFIRIVPDYSNKFGFEIVSIDDYKKQKEGYCLKEDRIFSEDEIYRRAVKSYLLTIREEAEYPKYYNFWEEEYSYNDACFNDQCLFYKFDTRNLEELNNIIVSIGRIETSEFIKKYGKQFELEENQILNKDGHLTHTIGFDNAKHGRLEIYVPDVFSLIDKETIKANKKLLYEPVNKKVKFSKSLQYSKYYLKVKYMSQIFDKIEPFNMQMMGLIRYYYIPITTCGEIKFSDIFDKPGGMKYTFSAGDNI